MGSASALGDYMYFMGTMVCVIFAGDQADLMHPACVYFLTGEKAKETVQKQQTRRGAKQLAETDPRKCPVLPFYVTV